MYFIGRCQFVTPEEIFLNEARDGYSYPRAYLIEISTSHQNACDVVPASTDEIDLMTQKQWEARHRQLLSSHSEADAMLGLASVAYWGFYATSTSGQKRHAARALARARWVLNGRARATRIPNAKHIHHQLRMAVNELELGNISEALLAVTEISEFGQVSFASKVLAAMAPETCGVYDRVLYNLLAKNGTSWAEYVFDPNRGMSCSKARKYQRWCELLSNRAQTINQLGLENAERSAEKTQIPWRAVDVERALFYSKDVAVLGNPR